MSLVEDILEANGPCLTNALATALINHGLTDEAARKQISRAGSNVSRLAHLTFPRKVRFLYLKKQYQSERYWDALKHAVLTHSPAYGPALAALTLRGGVIPKAHFQIVCGAPLKQKKHLSSEAIYERFKTVGLTREINIQGLGICVATADVARSPEGIIPGLKARLIAEEILLRAVTAWIRNLALASYHKVATREEGPEPPRVGTFAWDLTGPSYLSAIADWSKGSPPKPGFVACDVLLSHVVDQGGIAAFLKKCSTLRNLKNVGRCLQIFIAERYTDDAYASARTAGIVPATPSSLFGKDVAEGLTTLTQILSTAATSSLKPEIFDELFSRLGSIEGAAVNLRGALFELIAAELIRQLEVGVVTINKMIRNFDTGQYFEVDVISFQANKRVLFVECKGYKPAEDISDIEIERWLTKRIPFLHEQALLHSDWKDVEHRFEFWTSGSFSPKAIEMLKKASKSARRYGIGYKDSEALKEYVKSLKGSPLVKTLNEHFFRHPLAKITANSDARDGANLPIP